MIDWVGTTLRDLASSKPELLTAMWFFIIGSIVALLRSMVDGTRRSISRLLIACVFGGIGAVIANEVFHDWEYHIFLVGVGAVVAENLIIGFWNASVKFKDDPLNVFKDLWKLMSPTSALGHGANNESTPNDRSSSSQSDSDLK